MSVYNTSITIPSGQSLSPALEINDNLLMALSAPSAWTAADITFQVSHDNSTYQDLYDSDGEEFKATIVAGKFQFIQEPIAFSGFNYVKLRSGTSASPVNQAGDRQVITLFKENF